MTSEWFWIVVHKSDDDKWLCSKPFDTNREAWEEAKRLANAFKGFVFYVCESQHVSHVSDLVFRSVHHNATR